jgi:hypothetical protein
MKDMNLKIERTPEVLITTNKATFLPGNMSRKLVTWRSQQLPKKSNQNQRLGVVAHICNPSYLGGRDREKG